jgi:hypothetical protein
MTGPHATEVEKWIADVERELGELDAALGPLVERHVAVSERLGLLKRLLASLTVKDAGIALVGSGASGMVSAAQPNGTVRARVQAHVLAILSEVGTPLHINDIHAEFIKRGFEVPGAGKPNNITVHLSDAAGIVSTARGYYTANDVDRSDSAVRYPVVDQSRGKRAHG